MIIEKIFTLFRIILGGVFVFSGWNKLIRPVQEFQYVIEQYKTFPHWSIPIIAQMVPWYEFIFGTFLFLGFIRQWSARALAVMTAGFLLLLSSSMIRGIDLSNCGCFGEGLHLTPVQALCFDSVLMILLTITSVLARTKFELDDILKSNKSLSPNN